LIERETSEKRHKWSSREPNLLFLENVQKQDRERRKGSENMECLVSTVDWGGGEGGGGWGGGGGGGGGVGGGGGGGGGGGVGGAGNAPNRERWNQRDDRAGVTIEEGVGKRDTRKENSIPDLVFWSGPDL